MLNLKGDESFFGVTRLLARRFRVFAVQPVLDQGAVNL